MRAKIKEIPDGLYQGKAFVDSDGVIDEPLRINMKVRKHDTELYFDMPGSSPPCLGPMNSVIATTKSSVYLAIKHIFPDVPINAGTFDPLHIKEPKEHFYMQNIHGLSQAVQRK
ncbi:MAG: hypothetical protein CM1200mP30_33440 [Pseudomonadota bacterium]|nr:MAG: hypothetical protein CM1200mP30_33440 [Pseudomonadota bacterium]